MSHFSLFFLPVNILQLLPHRFECEIRKEQLPNRYGQKSRKRNERNDDNHRDKRKECSVNE